MVDKKTVFVAFAIEEERMRDLLKGQSLHPRSPRPSRNPRMR